MLNGCIDCLLAVPACLCLPAAGELWETSAAATGAAGDAYVPGRVALPPAAGRVVQLSAGDSHTCALTELGAVWAWGTYRDGSGVMGFSSHTRIQVCLCVCVCVCGG